MSMIVAAKVLAPAAQSVRARRAGAVGLAPAMAASVQVVLAVSGRIGRGGAAGCSGEDPLAELLADPDRRLDGMHLLVRALKAVDVADELGQVGAIVVGPGPELAGQLGVLHVDERLEEGRDRTPPHPC